MMRAFIFSAAAASVLLAASVNASAGTTLCRLSTRVCPGSAVVAPSDNTLCKLSERFCKGNVQ